MTALPISVAGIYPDIASSDYHGASITPEPALSSSLAEAIISTSPAHVWNAHPALNPDFEADTAGKFDLGTACHSLVLEGKSPFVIVRGHTKDGKESKGYTSEDAKQQRDAAYATGLTPLLPDEFDQVQAMALEMHRQLEGHPETGNLLINGTAEASLIWRDRRTGVWCKSRPDWFADGIVANYKTSGRAVGPMRDFARHVADMGYVQRAAWEIEGLRAIGVDIRRYLLVAQETSPPHIAVTYELGQSDLEYGAMLNRHALADFAECLRRGRSRECWPGYREPDRDTAGGIVPLSLPSYTQMAVEEWRMARQERDERVRKRAPDKKIMALVAAADRPME